MPPPLITDEQAEAFKAEVRELRALEANPSWQTLEKMLAEKEAEHLDGMSALAKTPEARAEHVLAWHDARELRAWLPTRLKVLTEKIGQYHGQ